MAYCTYCGNLISELATACPRCGHPNEARPLTPPAPAPAPGAPVDGRYASFWMRLLALVIDSLIVGLAVVALPFDDGLGPDLFPTSWFGGLPLVEFLYRWLMITFANGQTLGKMAVGIRIARPDRRPVDLGRAAARAGMAILSGWALGLGYLWAAWDPERRTWHDMVADTRAFPVKRP